MKDSLSNNSAKKVKEYLGCNLTYFYIGLESCISSPLYPTQISSTTSVMASSARQDQLQKLSRRLLGEFKRMGDIYRGNTVMNHISMANTHTQYLYKFMCDSVSVPCSAAVAAENPLIKLLMSETTSSNGETVMTMFFGKNAMTQWIVETVESARSSTIDVGDLIWPRSPHADTFLAHTSGPDGHSSTMSCVSPGFRGHISSSRSIAEESEESEESEEYSAPTPVQCRQDSPIEEDDRQSKRIKMSALLNPMPREEQPSFPGCNMPDRVPMNLRQELIDSPLARLESVAVENESPAAHIWGKDPDDDICEAQRIGHKNEDNGVPTSNRFGFGFGALDTPTVEHSQQQLPHTGTAFEYKEDRAPPNLSNVFVPVFDAGVLPVIPAGLSPVANIWQVSTIEPTDAGLCHVRNDAFGERVKIDTVTYFLGAKEWQWAAAIFVAVRIQRMEVKTESSQDFAFCIPKTEGAEKAFVAEVCRLVASPAKADLARDPLHDKKPGKVKQPRFLPKTGELKMRSLRCLTRLKKQTGKGAATSYEYWNLFMPKFCHNTGADQMSDVKLPGDFSQDKGAVYVLNRVMSSDHALLTKDRDAHHLKSIARMLHPSAFADEDDDQGTPEL